MLQLDAKTKVFTPAILPAWPSSTLARKLISNVDFLEGIAHGSFDMAAKCTTASTPEGFQAGSAARPKILDVALHSGRMSRVRQAVRKEPLVQAD